MDGGRFLSAVDGAGTELFGDDIDLVLGLGLGDMDDSIPLIFSGGGADIEGGNATGGCNKVPFGCKRLGASLEEGSIGNVAGDGDITDPSGFEGLDALLLHDCPLWIGPGASPSG